MTNNTYHHHSSFNLEKGGEIDELRINYATWGKLNAAKSNVVWVFHALTANADVLDWWSGLFGKGKVFTPEKYFIVCVNAIGSPYGSTSPADIQFGEEIWGNDFPEFTVRDVVKSQLLIAKQLGINQINVAIGGSFGGYQALEFTYAFKKIDHLILIATAAKESPWNIALHEAQRMALLSDESFPLKKKSVAKKALAACRAMAMLAYRTFDSFSLTQTDDSPQTDHYKAVSYVQYQGEKFVNRFQAHCYYYLLKCLDTHHIGRGRGGLKNALQKIDSQSLVIGIDTDVLIPTSQQKELFNCLQNAVYQEITSIYGHDGFLIETPQITEKIESFLNNN